MAGRSFVADLLRVYGRLHTQNQVAEKRPIQEVPGLSVSVQIIIHRRLQGTKGSGN